MMGPILFSEMSDVFNFHKVFIYPEACPETFQTSKTECFFEYSKRLLAVNYFHKTLWDV